MSSNATRKDLRYIDMSMADLKLTARERHIRYHRKSSRKTLVAKLMANDRRSIPYGFYTIKDLKKAIAGRKLSARGLKCRQDHVDFLLAADSERTFHPFLRLPSELRMQIYSIALTEDMDMELPPQPNLARVSKIVREECLPIFYSSNMFIIDLLSYRFSLFPGTPRMSMSHEAANWLQAITPANVRQLRIIRFRMVHLDEQIEERRAAVDIKLAPVHKDEKSCYKIAYTPHLDGFTIGGTTFARDFQDAFAHSLAFCDGDLNLPCFKLFASCIPQKPTRHGIKLPVKAPKRCIVVGCRAIAAGERGKHTFTDSIPGSWGGSLTPKNLISQHVQASLSRV